MFDLSILVVEDEADVRKNLSKILNRQFQTVYEAENGLIGLDLFTKKHPDIIISDIRMPRMNGIEMIEEIKKIDSEARILIATAYSDQEYLMKAINLNVDKFIAKPLDLPLLKQALNPIAADIMIRRANQKLQQYMTMLMQAIMHSKDVILIINREKVITFVNQKLCKMFGCEHSKLIGQSIDKIFYQNPELLNHIENLDAEGWLNDIEIIPPNRTKVTVSLSVSFIYNVDGSKGGYLLVFRDIQSRLELEAELRNRREIAEKNNRLKSGFLATMTQDIRSPMSSIIGLTSLLMDDPSIIGRSRDNLSLIQKTGKELIHQVNDVLDVTLIETGELILEKSDFDMRHVCDFLNELFESRAKKKNLFFKIHLDKSAQGIYNHDPYRLEQILINLIDNAIKFTEKGHVIVNIIAEESDSKILKFSVIDSGVGISSEMQIKMLNQNKSRLPLSDLEGLGLGTLIANNLAGLMDGEIGVLSPAVSLAHPDGGPGSEFWFKAPMKPAKQVKKPEEEQNKENIAQNIRYFQDIGIKVLIVEGNDINRSLIEKIMELMKIDYDSVQSGHKALESLKTEHYNAVFMDIELPEMDSIETIRKIRHTGNNIPIIACTDHGFYQEIAKCQAAGASKYLIKPFSKQKVLDLLVEIFKKH